MAQIDGAFWINKQGEKVHPELITADKKLEDELVCKMVQTAKTHAVTLAELRENSFEQVEGFFDLLLQNYNVLRTKDSKRGNISLTDFSGLNRVDVAMVNTISFDSKLKIAKLKIDEYLTEVTQNASAELKTLVLKAFEVDRKGDIDAKKILALRSYNIPHPKWQEAIAIIGEAVEVVSSKRYIRFYTRPHREDEWQHISLELASAKKREEAQNDAH